MNKNEPMFLTLMGLSDLIQPTKSRSEKGHICTYKRSREGEQSCSICGRMRDPEEYEEKSGLYDPKALTRAIYDDAVQLGIFARLTLSDRIKDLVERNKGSVKKSHLIIPHITKAIEKVDSMREYITIKGKTPIKMVAILAIQSLQGSCVERSDVLSLLDLQGSNIIPAQSALNDVLHSMSSLSQSDEAQSDICLYLKALPKKLSPSERRCADQIYETLDADKKWLCKTEQVRLRIAALGFLI